MLFLAVLKAFSALLGPVWASEEASGVIRGIAVDEEGVRLPQATVFLKRVDLEPRIQRFNSLKNGDEPLSPELDFEWTGLKAGTYELTGVGEEVKPLIVELKEGQMTMDEEKGSVP